ncbi:NOT2 / NOT3 / NOT5 family, partial [Rhizoctonia solani]
MSAADRWGLLGLLQIIKGGDPDVTLLNVGADLSGMGLDMGGIYVHRHLYPSFITPWSDASAALTVEPDYHLPACYNVQPPPPAQAKANAFSDETLFFMFYSSPRDVLQEMASQELYNRNWRFHKERRVWLTKESGTSPSQKTSTHESGVYTFFDPENWERVKMHARIQYDQLEEKHTVPVGGATRYAQ